MYKFRAKQKINPSQSGFALLISLIVVGVVVSVGLTILDLTIKQLGLSTNSRDSEIAFHATNAGLECASYWRNKEWLNLENGVAPDFYCFNQTLPGYVTNVSSGSDYDIYSYNYSTTWSNRCSDIKMVFIVVDNSAPAPVTVPYGDIQSTYGITNYPDINKDCEPGGRCAIISVRGYNKTCANIGSTGTLEREVLLES